MNADPQQRNRRKIIENYSFLLSDVVATKSEYEIYRGQNKDTKQKVLIKVTSLKSMQENRVRNHKIELQRQISTLKKLQHKNLVKCFDIYNTMNNCYMIFSECQQGKLKKYLNKEKASQKVGQRIIKGIYEGLKYLIVNNFLRVNLNFDSIEINKDNALINNVIDCYQINQQKNGISIKQQLLNPNYMNIRTLKTHIYDESSQIWAFGLIIYKMFNGYLPWEQQKNISPRQMIQESDKNLKVQELQISNQLKSFLKLCLKANKEQVTFYDLDKHPFIINLFGSSLHAIIDEFHPVKRSQYFGIKELNLNQKSVSLTESLGVLAKVVEEEICVQQDEQSKQMFLKNKHLASKLMDKTTKIRHLQAQFQNQINWMRFLYKINTIFTQFIKQHQKNRTPQNEGLVNTQRLRNLQIIVVKQMLCQLQTLIDVLQHKQNLLGFAFWDQLMYTDTNTNTAQNCMRKSFVQLHKEDILTDFLGILKQYKLKYENQKIYKHFQSWISSSRIKKFKKIETIADMNFIKCHHLSLIGIYYSLKMTQQLYGSLLVKNQQSSSPHKSHRFLGTQYGILFVLDFLITYYQLNCLLIDSSQPDYLLYYGKLDEILEFMPLGQQLDSDSEIVQAFKQVDIQERKKQVFGKMIKLQIIDISP